MTAAARSRLADLPDALDRAVAGTDLGMDRRPFWWRLVGALQWLVTLAAAGRAGLAGARLRAARARPAGAGLPRVGEVPLPTVLLLGGLLAGLLLAALTRPVIRLGGPAGPAAGRAAAHRARWPRSARSTCSTPVRAVLDRVRARPRGAWQDADRR